MGFFYLNLFFYFLRGHQELLVNISHVIFGKIVIVVIAQSSKELLIFC